MEVIVYQKRYHLGNSIESFLDRFFQKDMTYLASDLLSEGMAPEDIKSAVRKAIISTEKAGLISKKHFLPVISVKSGTSFLDCRLSSLGRFLVLLNVEPKSEYIATFQVKVAQQILNTNKYDHKTNR
tara:strand:- start:3050 stop:3430 length:381 start_codon:yes stop_codon:yes gene_type:complete